MPAAHAACLAMLGTGLHDAARRRADLCAGRPAARDRRDARAAGARDGSRAARRRGRRQRLRGLDRRAADGGRGRARDARRPGAATRRAGRRRPRSTWLGRRVLTRTGLSGVPETLERLPRLRDLDSSARVHALLRRARRGRGGRAHDQSRHRRRGRCRLRAHVEPRPRHRRLPPRSRRAAEQHARRGRPRPRAAPAGRADGEHDGADARVRRRTLELAIGSAGGTRLRTALVGVAAGILDEGLEPVDAVERPRFHRAGDVVNAEPGVDERALEELTQAGLHVRRWPGLHHYFGGVSLIGTRGAAGDPRRSGDAATLT